MSLNLHLGARSDERFHLQPLQPVPHLWGWRWLARRVSWSHLINEDGGHGTFTSWTIGWFLHIYYGSVKCDATRTFMFRAGMLGTPFNNLDYIMTTTPKELLAFRLRRNGMDAEPVWTNMGGA